MVGSCLKKGEGLMSYYLGMDLQTAERVMALRVEEAQGHTTSQSLLREAGVRQSSRPAWPAGRALWYLGHWLVRMGQWLELRSQPRGIHKKRQPSGQAAAGLGPG
jgi:hypothetical protein